MRIGSRTGTLNGSLPMHFQHGARAREGSRVAAQLDRRNGLASNAIRVARSCSSPHDLCQSQSTPSRRAHPPESDSSMA